MRYSFSGKLETHLHTAYSDGKLYEDELIEELYGAGDITGNLEQIAVTDHNSMNGYEPLLRANAAHCDMYGIQDPIAVVLGIEFDTYGYVGIRTHLLGYFPRFEPDLLNAGLRPIAERFVKQNNALVANSGATLAIVRVFFDELGIDCPERLNTADADAETQRRISQAKSKALARKRYDRVVWEPPVSGIFRRNVLQDLYGLPPLAMQFFSSRSAREEVTTRALVAFFQNLDENLSEQRIRQVVAPAFGIFLEFTEEQKARYPEAYAQYGKMDTSNGLFHTWQVVEAIVQAGGYAVLAHPIESYLKKEMASPPELYEFVRDLQKVGLGGVECFYPGQSEDAVNHLVAVCQDLGLVVLGGSDFHSKYPGETKALGQFSVDGSLDRLFGGRR